MFLSVLVPAYNEEEYLPACLQALQRQTYPAGSYEIIVIDNASTDATARVARRFGARVIHEPARGIARARQAGFESARGQVIASTDADTLVPPFWLARIAAHLAIDPGLGAVYGPVYWADGRPHEQFIMKYPVTWAFAVSNLAGKTLWSGSNFAVRSAVLWQVGGLRGFQPDGMLGEDLYLSLNINRVARIRFDLQLAVYTSARRAREGYGNYLRRVAVNAIRVLLKHEPPLPSPDIR